MCELEQTLETDVLDKSTKDIDVNLATTLTAMSTGIGYSQCEEMIAVLDVPLMTHKTYQRCHESVAEVICKTALLTIEEAGKEEAALAIALMKKAARQKNIVDASSTDMSDMGAKELMQTTVVFLDKLKRTPEEIKQLECDTQHKPFALYQFQEEFSVYVESCGLFVDLNDNFLAASPDGIVTETGELIEVKYQSAASVRRY
ncbi:hypothetical protein ILUMI_03655 [Ignelater luminosus]|uniref:Mutator-like transposase domain-containing protein n=1 Tax=Ignelater luminosus TaxID=2038154 RepID=A0A8K0GI41_IGNLU|nr:hypothetical protein ILUMI_03655 [Ignelater luminosus]